MEGKEGKVRCIIKRPDEHFGHVTNISTSLKNLQKTVDGLVESIRLGSETVILVNEEGRLKGLPYNFTIRTADGFPLGVIVGTAIVIGTDGAEFADLKMDFKTWKRILIGWGN